MNAGELARSIKGLENENIKAEALRDQALKDLTTLLNCKEDGIDAAIATLQKRKEAAETKITDLEAKIEQMIPPEYRERMGMA